eukprot:TRINITY_DN4275_c0_g2_i10.p1 TRINITY_DN4275_c0_g2~~TRINITY_DN4275_c0_g2_i10.p1  ORF type:complete len:406 (+),score=77.51 TRINITY_DN4275_c0_g2_i10:238-1455(+)
MDQCPSHSYSYSESILRSSFAIDSISEIFSELDPVPLASGAIAQVHEGILRDGTRVAVKVLHPGIVDILETDLTLMRYAVDFIYLFPEATWSGLREALCQFEASMRPQSDLSVEAKNLQRFRRNFVKNPHIIFPTVISASTHSLIETFEEGDPIYNYLPSSSYIPKNTEINKKLAEYGLDAFLQMMLVHNFVHADLHPGNILVRESQDESSALEKFIKKIMGKNDENLGLVILDCGLVTVASPTNWEALKALLVALAGGDGRKGAEAMIKYAKSHNLNERDKEEFMTRMGDLFNMKQWYQRRVLFFFFFFFFLVKTVYLNVQGVAQQINFHGLKSLFHRLHKSEVFFQFFCQPPGWVLREGVKNYNPNNPQHHFRSASMHQILPHHCDSLKNDCMHFSSWACSQI